MASTRVSAAEEQRVMATTLDDSTIRTLIVQRAARRSYGCRYACSWTGNGWSPASIRPLIWAGCLAANRGAAFGSVQCFATAPARVPMTYDWYRSFIQALLDAEHYTWFAQLVTFEELLIGIALIIGAFTVIAAFSGGS